MKSQLGVSRPDVVILSDDFTELKQKSCLWATRLSQEAEFFAALDGLGASDGSQLVEGAGTVCLDSIFGNEKLRGDLAITESAGDQVQDFELACRDAEGLLASSIGNERFEGGCFDRNKHLLHNYGFAIARKAESEPDSEAREKNGNERAVELDGVLDDHETIFGVLKDSNEETSDNTEDEHMTSHGGVVKKYSG